MSSPISTILANLRRTVNILRSAVYAIDVRDDIADAIDDSADAIEQIYSDVDSASLREDAFAAALQEAIDDNLLPIPATVIDDNSLPGTKIQNASIPLSKLAEPVQITVDSALSGTSTNPVQNKVIKETIDELNGSLENRGLGITESIKNALLACFENVEWSTPDGKDKYNILKYELDDYRNRKVWTLENGISVFKGNTVFYAPDIQYDGYLTNGMRRSIGFVLGSKKILNRATMEETPYYPIPVPKNAKSIKINVEPNTLQIGSRMFTLEDGQYVSRLDPGYYTGQIVMTIPSAYYDKDKYLTAIIKKSNNTSISASEEPTAITITYT